MSARASDLKDLYRQIVLDHSRHPRNQRRPERFDREAEGHNPLCGDKVRIYLDLQGGVLQDVAFEATGCAICLASASLMTECTRGRAVPEARAAIDRFEQALTTDGSTLTGDLAALGGVSQYPSRIRCATLPWKTLRAALDAYPDTVTTE
ncbi:MAG: SUF system NifU family Fe-S cluster assembly protein [Gammaproteobacteria bacterium]|nr:SUF system NifU family Fe-S cluster assembly protein [Gammaproteobacteria bacterium]MDH5274898.1 SUF system NifU family Fe-S cluster assembly protein [Gammaproteobacteria bacterium]